jgi:hypothetical protein
MTLAAALRSLSFQIHDLQSRMTIGAFDLLGRPLMSQQLWTPADLVTGLSYFESDIDAHWFYSVALYKSFLLYKTTAITRELPPNILYQARFNRIRRPTKARNIRSVHQEKTEPWPI